MEDKIISGIPYESHQERDGKVITLKASKYATQKQINTAIQKVRFIYGNRYLLKIIVKQSKGESFA